MGNMALSWEGDGKQLGQGSRAGGFGHTCQGPSLS